MHVTLCMWFFVLANAFAIEGVIVCLLNCSHQTWVSYIYWNANAHAVPSVIMTAHRSLQLQLAIVHAVGANHERVDV